MSNQPTVENRSEQPAIAIPIHIRREEMPQAVGLIGEVLGWAAAHGIHGAGPVYFRYLSMSDNGDNLEMEVGAIVPAAVAGDDRVQSTCIPAGRYATYLHHGHPDRLMQAHEMLNTWLVAHDLTVKVSPDGPIAGIFELYLSDPAVQPDMAQWDTEILMLLND